VHAPKIRGALAKRVLERGRHRAAVVVGDERDTLAGSHGETRLDGVARARQQVGVG
jgi:hypothetical protein